MKLSHNIQLFHLVLLIFLLSVSVASNGKQMSLSDKHSEQRKHTSQLNTTFVTRKFDDSRAGKVAQLQAIRMHNVLRTVPRVTRYSNIVGPKEANVSPSLKLEVKGKKITKKVMISALTRPEPISEKRLKVQKWEAIYQ